MGLLLSPLLEPGQAVNAGEVRWRNRGTAPGLALHPLLDHGLFVLIHVAVDPRVVILAAGQHRSGHKVPITGRLGVHPDLSRVSGEVAGGGGRQGEAGRGEVGIRGLPIASNLVRTTNIISSFVTFY